jgi:hypothetical protein
VETESGYAMYSPTGLGVKRISEKNVLAWVTRTPIVSVSEGQMLHGLFQDKVIWSSVDSKLSPELKNAGKSLLSKLVLRLEQEVGLGILKDSSASILRLASGYDKMPDSFRKRLLFELKKIYRLNLAVIKKLLVKLDQMN